MLRMGKLTDYGMVVMTYLGRQPERMVSASEVAGGVKVALPTVSKLLKALAQAGLLASHRGVKGGYHLARAPENITVAEIVSALEGPISLTECSTSTGECDQESVCSIRNNWQKINRVVFNALEDVTLADMIRPQAHVIQDMRGKSLLGHFGSREH
jgi:FeS assembly SUF system regulator